MEYLTRLYSARDDGDAAARLKKDTPHRIIDPPSDVHYGALLWASSCHVF